MLLTFMLIYGVLEYYDVYVYGKRADLIILYNKSCNLCKEVSSDIKALLNKMGYKVHTCDSGYHCAYALSFLTSLENIIPAQPIGVVYREDGVRALAYNIEPVERFWIMLRDTPPSEKYISIYYRSEFWGLLRVNKCVSLFFEYLKSAEKEVLEEMEITGCSENDFIIVS